MQSFFKFIIFFICIVNTDALHLKYLVYSVSALFMGVLRTIQTCKLNFPNTYFVNKTFKKFEITCKILYFYFSFNFYKAQYSTKFLTDNRYVLMVNQNGLLATWYTYVTTEGYPFICEYYE